MPSHSCKRDGKFCLAGAYAEYAPVLRRGKALYCRRASRFDTRII